MKAEMEVLKSVQSNFESPHGPKRRTKLTHNPNMINGRRSGYHSGTEWRRHKPGTTWRKHKSKAVDSCGDDEASSGEYYGLGRKQIWQAVQRPVHPNSVGHAMHLGEPIANGVIKFSNRGKSDSELPYLNIHKVGMAQSRPGVETTLGIQFDPPQGDSTNSQQFLASGAHAPSFPRPNGHKMDFLNHKAAGAHMGSRSLSLIPGTMSPLALNSPTLCHMGNATTAKSEIHSGSILGAYNANTSASNSTHMGGNPPSLKSGDVSGPTQARNLRATSCVDMRESRPHVTPLKGNNTALPSGLSSLPIGPTTTSSSSIPQVSHPQVAGSFPINSEAALGVKPVQDIGTSKPPSWAALLKPNVAPSFKLHYIKPNRNQKNVIIKMPKAITEVGSREWDNTLVGYFIGRKLPYSLIKNATSKLWSKAGLVDMLATDSGYFFFKFSSQAESEAVLEGGPWHVAGQPIILSNWQVGLRLEKVAQSTIPIWVNIHHIPLEYWNSEGLSHIASAIGKPLYVDRMTASCRRISYARLCIEVNAEFELLKNFDIEVEDPISGTSSLISLHVEYQWSPIRCAKCKKFGHDCARLHKAQAGAKPVPPIQQAQDQGAWMVMEKGKSVLIADPTMPSTSNGLDTSIPPNAPATVGIPVIEASGRNFVGKVDHGMLPTVALESLPPHMSLHFRISIPE